MTVGTSHGVSNSDGKPHVFWRLIRMIRALDCCWDTHRQYIHSIYIQLVIIYFVFVPPYLSYSELLVPRIR